MKRILLSNIVRDNLWIVFLFVLCYSTLGYSQHTKSIKPKTVTKTSDMRIVPSLASRTNLIPFKDIVKEAQDGRSLRNVPLPLKGSTGNDYFYDHPHTLEQSRASRTPSLVFDVFASSSQPTDPSGAVGPNHYIGVYNTGFIIFDKAGNDLTGQLAVTNIFSSGGCCDLTASYDKAADRWVLSYLFFSGGAEVAVSDGPNPLTANWYVYTASSVNDYQKLSVWSDGYYMTENTGGTNKIWAFERDEMLLGNPSAQIIGFDLPGIVTSGFFSPQAFNVSNEDMPAAGSMPIVYLQDDAWSGVSDDHLKIWEVDVDWNNTLNSTISPVPQEISLTSFNSVFDNGNFDNLTQPGGGSDIDALQATIMNQAQFRKFPTHNSAVFNFVVDVDGGIGELAGIRWIELRQDDDGLPWYLYQEGTYTAPDGKHAWNASLIMDNQGNIGMGYTGMSGPTTPSTVRVSSFYTGRLASDPLGTMTFAEETIANGNANIPGLRYGDYSKIDVDPSDDQTFWFIDEYMNSGRKGVVGVFKIAPDTPIISYSTTSGNTIEDTNCDFVDISIPLTIGIGASQNADVDFAINGSSTAIEGFDFDLLTSSVTFPAGSTTPQDLEIRVYHDGFVETEETVIVEFTVNANGGDAIANTSADSFTLTITDDNSAPISFQNAEVFSEGFEAYSNFTINTIGSWTMLDGDGDSTWGSSAYDYPNENYTGTFMVFNSSQTTPSAIGTDWDAHSGSKGYYCFSSTGDVSGTALNDDYIFSPQIQLNGVNSELRFWAKSVTDLYGLERFRVGISNSGTNIGDFSIISPGSYLEAPIAWTEYVYDLSAYDGDDIYITFHVISADAFAFMLDDISVTTEISTGVQTAVNDGTTNDSQSLATIGTIYTSDSSTGNVMLDITNNQSDDYGCLDVSVSRSGTGAQTYNGSSHPNLVMDKIFSIDAENEVFGGDVSITFYFTEAEISGWESATGLSRNALVAGREFEGLLLETSTLSIGSFGPHVTLTGTFSGLSDRFVFGPTGVSELAITCSSLKVWGGSSWLGGVPANTDRVFIAEDYHTSEANIDACNLLVRSTKTLTIASDDYVKTESNIRVDGTLIIENGGSLVQVDDAAVTINNGLISVEKITPNLNDADFTIMGSPMSGESTSSVYNSAFIVRNHITGNFVPHPQVAIDDPTAENFADDNGDNWQNYSGSLIIGEGYLVKPYATGSGSSGTYTTTYTQGTLNNGVVNFTAIFGDDQNDSPNILANPYASAVDAFEFITDNSIVDAIYYWEHINAPSSSYPGYNISNYDMGDISMYNLSGGLSAANEQAGDPIAKPSNQFIPSGQGFGIKANAAGDVTFNNSMRVTDQNTNYRTNQTIDRVYLSLMNETYQLQSGTLIAFAEGATNDFDRNYDAKRLATPVSIYSIIDDMELGIQGREPFTSLERIPLGFSTQVEELQEYVISLQSIEGTSISQNEIYLEDQLLHTLTNLTETDYHFIANEGHQTDRFVLVFNNEQLETTSWEDSSVLIYPNPVHSILNIESIQSGITNIKLIDVRGREIFSNIINHQKSYDINLNNINSGIYFVEIQTERGVKIEKLVKK